MLGFYILFLTSHMAQTLPGVLDVHANVLESRTGFSQIYSKWDRLLFSIVATGTNPLFTSS